MKKTKLPSIPAPPGFYGCPLCKAIKPVSEFYVQANGPQGHSSFCKPCKRQYKRDREMAGQAEDRTAVSRYWPKVKKGVEGPLDTPCWIWTGATRHGHGHFFYMGKMRRAHRVALIFAGKPAPDDLMVDHMCRVRGCVNPDHLRVVTAAQNALENNDNPLARNARVKRCKKGHLYTPENTAIKPTIGPKGTKLFGRYCLTCFPANWRYAIVPRQGTRASLHWVGPPQGWLDKQKSGYSGRNADG
jgi:hypothetical protein